MLSYSITNRDGYREYKSRGYICCNCPQKSKCTESKDHVKLVTQHVWERYIEKAEDDLTPKTRENITLEELMKSWLAKLNDNCIFISAREKINMDELKTIIYNKVRELHVQKYPYNDFLYQTYDEE